MICTQEGVGVNFFSFEADPKVLRDVAGHGDDISAGLHTGGSHLDDEHAGIGKKGEGFTFVDEISKVEHSWSDRIEAMRKECEGISHNLRETAQNYEKNEEKTSSSFSDDATGMSGRGSPSSQKYLSDFG